MRPSSFCNCESYIHCCGDQKLIKWHRRERAVQFLESLCTASENRHSLCLWGNTETHICTIWNVEVKRCLLTKTGVTSSKGFYHIFPFTLRILMLFVFSFGNSFNMHWIKCVEKARLPVGAVKCQTFQLSAGAEWWAGCCLRLPSRISVTVKCSDILEDKSCVSVGKQLPDIVRFSSVKVVYQSGPQFNTSPAWLRLSDDEFNNTCQLSDDVSRCILARSVFWINKAFFF